MEIQTRQYRAEPNKSHSLEWLFYEEGVTTIQKWSRVEISTTRSIGNLKRL